MSKRNIFFQQPLRLFFSFMIIWFILFEFVLVANGILPKPTSVIDTITDIFEIYNLPTNILYSFGAVTFGLILSILLVLPLKNLLMSKNYFTDLILAVNKLKHFIPIVIISSFIILWFKDSIYTEYVFIMLGSFLFLSSELILCSNKIKDEYLTAAKSLNIPDRIINSNIKFKLVLPLLESSFLKLHFIVWSILLIFEIIQNHMGIGSVIYSSIKYLDIPTLFVITLIVYLLITFGYYTIKFLYNRFIYWE